MMAKVMHSWVCMAHGEFMSYTGDCKHGCSSGMVRKLMGASIVTSGKTRFIDKKIADIARQSGETEFNDRHDHSRIKMPSTGTLKDKWLRGETFGMESGVTMGADGAIKDDKKVASVIGELGASTEKNLAHEMAVQGRLNTRINVIAEDKI